MIIHSHKATKDIEEVLPEELPAKHRDLILRVAIAARTGDPVLMSELAGNLASLANALADAQKDAVFRVRWDEGQVTGEKFERVLVTHLAIMPRYLSRLGVGSS